MTSLRAAMLCLSGVLALLFFVKAPPAYAQQVTLVPPFVGTNSETWERFGVTHIPNGTSILGGIATISGTRMVTATSFIMCTVIGRPSDGTILMDQDRPNDLVTISFSQPVSAFGAYWGSGVGCSFGDAASILTFQDVNGNVIGITGAGQKNVIVRAIGPSLARHGIANPLQDPTLELHNGNGALIAFNDNWKDTQQAQIQATGLAPTNDKESAIMRTLAPGNYTAIVRGKNNTIGVALVEVYGLN